MLLLLKACLNGARTPEEHPALPVTPEQLADDAARVRAAGAQAVHLHVKDAQGADTLDGELLAEVLAAVRRSAPGLAVGVTTGAWSAPDPVRRVSAVRAWTALPDFASVNWHEPGAEQVAQVLLELPDGLDERGTAAQAEQLLGLLSAGGNDVPVLLHGEGSSCWPALRHAAGRGLATRIGLEDVLTLPDGSPAPDNAALVSAAAALLAPSRPASDGAPGGDAES